MKENLKVIKEAVRDMGGKMISLSRHRDAYKIEIDGKSFLFVNKFAIRDDLISTPSLVKYKDLTYEVFKKAGIKTPKTILIDAKESREEIRKKLAKFHFPVIVKDAQGTESKGVFSDINDLAEAEEIIVKNIKEYGCFIVQEMIQGKEYRVLILDGKVLGALNMVPPHIIGDGKSTILQLIDRLQKNTETQTPRDEHLRNTLKRQGESLKSIPQKGKVVYLRRNSCLAEGGVSIDVTDHVSPELAKILSQALKAVGLRLGGIDIFCSDIKNGEKDYQIIEINGKPDTYIHHRPIMGKPRKVTQEILRYITKNII